MRSPYSISTHAFYFLLGSGVVFQSLPGISSDDMSPPACAHSPALELSPVPTAPAQAPSLPPGPGARCLSDPEGQAASWLTAGTLSALGLEQPPGAAVPLLFFQAPWLLHQALFLGGPLTHFESGKAKLKA